MIALLAALAAERWIPVRSKRPTGKTILRATAGILLLAAGVEAARFLSKPGVRVDGVAVGAGPLSSADEHRTRRIEVGSGR